MFMALAVISLSFPSGLPVSVSCFGVGTVYAQEDWKKEFEEICSRTNDAMSFSKEDLKVLIERCDKLKTAMERLDESSRKVYLRRLQACRDLLKFVLDSKENPPTQ